MNIQTLISAGNTLEALDLLEDLDSSAILLRSRFNGAKRQYSMGMIDFSEWSRTQAQINYAILEIASKYTPKVAVVSQTIVLNYFNFERKPGNDVGLVNKIFRTFHTMVDDLEYP